MNLRISVVIPAYNYGRYLPQAIDSVLAQSLPPHEVIIVDDGSTDETPQVLASYGSRIRVIRQTNQGVSAAASAGAAAATGDLLAFLDADDWWLGDKLKEQAAKFDADPQLGLVHCGIEEVDASGNTLCRRTDGLEGWVANEMLLFRKTAILAGGSGALMWRRVFNEVGGFDRRISVSQDWDLCYRITRHYRVGFVPKVLVCVRLHGANPHVRNIRKMEHDMLLGFEKAFESDVSIAHLRRQAYGKLHMVLAGCYHSAGQPVSAARHALRSLWLAPGNSAYLLGFPLRRLRAAHKTGNGDG